MSSRQRVGLPEFRVCVRTSHWMRVVQGMMGGCWREEIEPLNLRISGNIKVSLSDLRA